MGDDERPDAPQLEAPTLGRLFGRRKDRAQEPAPATAVEPVAEPVSEPDVAPAAEPTAPADWAPVEKPAPVEPAAPVEDTSMIEPAEPVAPADTPAAAAPVPSAEPDTPPAPQTAVAAAVPAPIADLSPLNQARAEGREPRRTKAPRATLTVGGRVASAVTGLVIGLLVVVLTAGSLALCETVRGVASCGGGPGFALLVAVTLSMIVLGGVMLRLARVPDPGSTSFLAVGLLCVLSLLFLVDVLDEWWMVIVIPALSTVTFLLSHWVTTAVVENE